MPMPRVSSQPPLVSVTLLRSVIVPLFQTNACVLRKNGSASQVELPTTSPASLIAVAPEDEKVSGVSRYPSPVMVPPLQINASGRPEPSVVEYPTTCPRLLIP